MENLEHSNDTQDRPLYTRPKDESDNHDSRENANTGDWEDERDETGRDADYYDTDNQEEGGNDNSGGAGSSGSAATNS